MRATSRASLRVQTPHTRRPCARSTWSGVVAAFLKVVCSRRSQTNRRSGVSFGSSYALVSGFVRGSQSAATYEALLGDLERQL
ncbi:hypothetical protein ACU635_22205 [[Actinomadura] parvosata]|uniref:hypothetical protein n=1 Tax=[Actinomadura] parvosata TaxID=1955412 RepID=UPI00406C378F